MSCNLIALLLTINCIFIHVTADSQCFSTDNDHFKCHFGSKTPYRFIANHNDSQFNYPGCTEKKLWLLVRHGTRFPAKKDTSRMIHVLPKLQQEIIKHYKMNQSMLSAETVDELVRWNLTLVMDDHMKLVGEGEKELIDLAERFQSRFPNLLPEAYSNHTFKFKYTPSQRTEESAKHFTLGLFGHHASQQVWYHPPEDKDTVLRYYKHCYLWQSKIRRNPAANEQMRLFARSKIVNGTLDQISQLLGFKIDYDDASLMYDTCGYEIAWAEKASSPWCDFFSLDNFKIMEYVEDLDSFWINGYGYALTYEQACPTLRDVFQFFNAISDQTATVYFSHSGSILKLLAHLGLAKDAMKLTHDSFELHRDNRAWRTSRIDAFASNIGFILYECDKDGPSISAMHQERVVHIPGCPENVPCPISVFEKIFSQSIHECHFEEMCSDNASNRTGVRPTASKTMDL